MKKTLRQSAYALAITTMMAVAPVQAGSNDIALGTIAQPVFNNLVEEFGQVIAYNPASPAETLGIIGFEVGLGVEAYELDTTIWDQVVSDASAPSTIPVPKLSARKGLPMGIDVGLSYTTLPGSNIKIMGGEIRKSIIDGGMAMPAVSVIAHTSRLTGVDDISLDTYGVDVGISKGFVMLTPYAGVGQVWINGSSDATTVTLADHDASVTRSYAGVRIGFMPMLNLVLQANIADVNSYTGRLNLTF